MSLTANTQAILLLTAHLDKTGDEHARPLTIKEWGRFALWLREKVLRPEDLLTGNPADKLQGWSDAKIPFTRIESLLNRGSALAICLEKWTRAGLWVMTRSDPDYPKRLKTRLKNDSPAILFGCGNRSLLNQGGLAVVGSRKAIPADLDYTAELGRLASLKGNSIVSGGARGVDETAMLAALEVEGTVIGVLADSLLRAVSSARYRRYLMNSSLVLISPFNPEAGFNAGNAMQRNKYIYCLADVAVAVHSGKEGGTWEGAIENLKHEWVPLRVKSTNDLAAGNAGLVAKGASWLSGDITQVDLDEIFYSRLQRVEEPDIFNNIDLIEEPVAEPVSVVVKENIEEETEKNSQQVGEQVEAKPIDEFHGNEETLPTATLPDISFYELFLTKLQLLLSGVPKSVDELEESLGINKAQLNIWLAQAVKEKKIKKNKNPVSYELVKQISFI